MAPKNKRTKRAPKRPRLPKIDVHALAARGATIDATIAEACARLGRIEGRVVRLEVAVNPQQPLPPRPTAPSFPVCNIVDCPSGRHSMPSSPCPIANCPRKTR